MNTKLWIAALLAMATLFAPASYSTAESGLEGKWATDAGRYLDNRETTEINAGATNAPVVDPSGGLRPNTNTRGGLQTPGTGNRGLGTNGGTFGGRGLGGNNFQAQRGLGRSGSFGNTSGFGNSPFGNGTRGNNGMNNIPVDNPTPRLGAAKIPEGPALMMDLKVDKKSKLTGTMTVYLYDEKVKTEKAKMENGLVVGKSFTFNTTHKIDDEKFANTWKGEQTSENTIRVSRLKPSGEPLDDEEIVFRRTQ